MREYTYRELKESRLIYDRRPPAFGIIMTVMTLLFMTAGLLWAGFARKTYVILAPAVVVSESKVNVMNDVEGGILTVDAAEGQAVRTGDVLFTIDSFSVELSMTQLESMIGLYESRIGVLRRFTAFLNDFRLDDPESRINPFNGSLDGDNEEFKVYSDAKSFIDYVAQQEKAAAEKDPPEEYPQSEVDNLKTQFLSSQYVQMDDYEEQLTQYESQLSAYGQSLAAYTVRAKIDGVLHLSAGLTVGTVLPKGSVLGSISAESPESFYFEAAVTAADRARLGFGDSAELAVTGAMQTEYGVIRGSVELIDSDGTQDQEGRILFKIKIKPEKTFLEDKKGNRIDITTGMTGEGRIKYDETTWLKWMIEQIGIKFR